MNEICLSSVSIQHLHCHMQMKIEHFLCLHSAFFSSSTGNLQMSFCKLKEIPVILLDT